MHWQGKRKALRSNLDPGRKKKKIAATYSGLFLLMPMPVTTAVLSSHLIELIFI
jgi:hypothetical protein